MVAGQQGFAQRQLSMGTAAVPFVIPREAEGSAVSIQAATTTSSTAKLMKIR
jgi:hypothetical protein